MTIASSDQSVVAFAEKLFMLLDEGRKTATYKYAVLLGLIDLCLEHSTERGDAPTSVTTAQLARKVCALYWPQTSPFGAGERVLKQNKGGQGEILQLIARCRDGLTDGPLLSYGSARARHPERIAKLEREIEWKLVEMPLPRLQRIGANELPLLYRIGWSLEAMPTRREFLDGRTFSNNIAFVHGASEHLVRLAPLLRPLIQKQWATMVSELNDLPDAQLEQHLFGRDRIALAKVAQPLREVQHGICLYCGERLTTKIAVDHFIPWSRHPDDGLDNLVASHERCNGDKRDFLASADHVRAWSNRNLRRASELSVIARDHRWEREPEQTLSTARGIYLRLSPDVRLWRAGRDFVEADLEELRTAFRSAA